MNSRQAGRHKRLNDVRMAQGMAGALDTCPRRDLAEYFLNIPIYFQLYLKNILWTDQLLEYLYEFNIPEKF